MTPRLGAAFNDDVADADGWSLPSRLEVPETSRSTRSPGSSTWLPIRAVIHRRDAIAAVHSVAFGTKQTCRHVCALSAFGGKADKSPSRALCLLLTQTGHRRG
jgi:hypothetical protein